VQKKGAVPFDIYLVDVREVESNQERAAADNLRLDQASLLRPFGVVARFYNLIPNRAYQISATVEDPEGTILKSGARNLQTESGTGWVYFPFYPDPDKHESGEWTAKIILSGVTTITHEFKVKELTDDEEEFLANHEQAKNQALRAFAHAWVVVPHQKIKTYATATNEQKGAEDDPLAKLNLYQVAGLDYKMEQLYLSPADRLNGITYRGIARFSFTVYRVYSPSDGWTEWTDVKRQENEYLAPLLEAWSQALAPLGGAEFNMGNIQLAPHMLFQLEKRDDHWWTITQEGMRFMDGSRNGTGNAAFIRAPRNFEKNQILRADNIFQPTIEAVAEVSDKGHTDRAELLELAKRIAASPEVLKKQQKDTLEALE
jgi:hypothetical protein